MKTCFKCSRSLPPEEFYRHPMTADGLLGKCKECTRRDVQENYVKRRDQYLEYERVRSKLPHRLAGVVASQKKRPDRLRARRIVHIAVANGSIVKPERCQDCNTEGPVEGHHEDYSKPLEVVWVCRPCHGKRHRMQPAA